MGNKHSKNKTKYDIQCEDHSNAIERQLTIDAELFAKEVKLLLLGAGESGKSTIVKQMKIIHENGYTKDDCLRYRRVILSNLVQSMITILDAMEKLKIFFANPSRVKDAKIVRRLVFTVELTSRLSHELSEPLKRLWLDEDVRVAFSRSREYQLNDSAK